MQDYVLDQSHLLKYFAATHDTAGTLEKMPCRYSREGIIMRGLHRHGYTSYGCQSALMSIPHSWRTLYVQSFTSLMFNHLATYRVREYGLKPVEGDLVLKQVDDPSRLFTLRDRVHVLTRQEINSGQYSLRDVVLPLIGTNTVLPGNRVGDKLKEILCAVGITLGSFRINGLRMHLPGSYRRLIAYPKQLSWQWIPANKLATSSRQGIVGTGATTSYSTAATVNQSVRERDRRKNTVAPDAIELSFSLENSCYATVFLREVMKQ